jgi:hypothetical protein
MRHLRDKYNDNALCLGNAVIRDIVKLHGIDDLPDEIGSPSGFLCNSTGFNSNTILSLELPIFKIPDSYPDSLPYYPQMKVLDRWREFYLCFWPQNNLLFIVETETRKHELTNYRAQYGANDNYDKSVITQRIAWVYTMDSARANSEDIAHHLKPFLPHFQTP